MRPLSESAARIAGRSFERKYIALGRIVKAWEQIVGSELASKAQPVKINYRKAKKADMSGGKSKAKGSNGGAAKAVASLDIAVSSADATLLHYQKDLILERINQVFGERWISGIRFVQVPMNTQRPARRKRLKPLSVSDKNSLSALLHGIDDPDIKERLESLGTSVLTSE